MIGVLLSVVGSVMSVLMWSAPQPAVEPEAPPAAPAVETPREDAAPAPPPEATSEISTVDDLLMALESAGTGMESLTAQVMYTRTHALEGDAQTRMGDLYFIAKDGAQGFSRRFGVHWTELRVDDRVDHNFRQAFIFDGEWLVERDDVLKQFIKRQVVAPGEKFDPLRLGEGPFPIPIGQTRADIVARFEAAMPAVDEGLEDAQLLAVVRSKPTYQLHLKPRPGFDNAGDLSEIRIWYRAGTLLPVLAWTQTGEGNESTVVLMNVKTNEPIDPTKLDTTTPDRGWNVEITKFAEDGR